MARTKAQIADSEATPDEELEPVETENETPEAEAPKVETPDASSNGAKENQDIDEILNSLKTLLSTVEKLQKVRQEVGDIKPLLLRMLDGELVSGEDLEQLKTGVGGLTKLVRAHTDHQAALVKAQVARDLLDDVLKF